MLKIIPYIALKFHLYFIFKPGVSQLVEKTMLGLFDIKPGVTLLYARFEYLQM